MLSMSHLTVTREIRDAIQLKVKDYPIFAKRGGGAIRISFYPFCKEADDWLGGLGQYMDMMNRFNGKLFQRRNSPCYEFVFGVTPGKGMVITDVWDNEWQQVSCYGYSALKIAHAYRAAYEGKEYCSGIDLGIPYLVEENGYAAHPGALGFIIKYKGSFFFDIAVCVSGATSEEDKECVAAAIRVVEDLFANEKDFAVVLPDLSAK